MTEIKQFLLQSKEQSIDNKGQLNEGNSTKSCSHVVHVEISNLQEQSETDSDEETLETTLRNISINNNNRKDIHHLNSNSKLDLRNINNSLEPPKVIINSDRNQTEGNQNSISFKLPLISSTSLNTTTSNVTFSPDVSTRAPIPKYSSSSTTYPKSKNNYTAGRNRSVSNVNPTTASSELLPRSQRVWEMDRHANECKRCHKRFNFLIRKHHCRRCGQIVCDKCSSNRIKLPVEELIEDPMISKSQYPAIASQSQRVCDSCYREPIRRSSDVQIRKNNQRYRASQGNNLMRRENDNGAMMDCPVCNQSFLGMQKRLQEEHLERCLNTDSPPVNTPKYLVYNLSAGSPQIDEECPICFEEFQEGDKISRMLCLCSYHKHCLTSWLEKGKGCPVHYDFLN